jgi:glycosyltransferase involved in cell wall biosynthesis
VVTKDVPPNAIAAGVPHVVHTVWTAEGRFRPWQFAYARLLAGACDRIICVSESVREHHSRRSGLPAGRYAVIPWGVDVAAFSRDEAARRRLRQEWAIPAGAVLVAFVGRLEFYKGIDTLLSAASHLAARGDAAHLVIAGDGPRRAIVENFLAHGEGGRLARFLGHVGDVRGVLSAADIYVMPSLWEGWPLALGEAMAAGLPAIGANVPGIRDLIAPERTGLLIGREDSVALADAVERLAGDADLRARLGEAGRQRIAEHFTLDATVAAHERLYDEIAGHPTRRGGQD